MVPGPDDYVIAADSGGRHALDWGWPVHLLIGDLDSLDPAGVQALQAQGASIILAPVAKDETDLELALAQALAGEAEEIIICAALGGRLDHLLANVLVLAWPDLAGRDVRIVDGPIIARCLRGLGDGALGLLALEGKPGDLLSLLPLGDAAGITTSGLLYPLRDETLYLGQGRGVSNCLTGAAARVTLRDGLLLVVHTRLGGIEALEGAI
jgi:thiamine pyrophosphokinase